MMLLSVLIGLLGSAHAHMGVSGITTGNTVALTQPREKPVVGDVYRNPNSGHCHGVLPGATPQGTLVAGSTYKVGMSFGAAHNGGHCALFISTGKDETVWHKQMDNVGCTLNGKGMDWTIDKSLVPKECGTQCSLIWAWSPVSSGTCEFYLNCFDIRITGLDAAGGASSVQVRKDMTCVRVNTNTHRTPSYGAWCGPSCGSTVAGTSAPTAQGAATIAPTPYVSTAVIPFRCGATWNAANDNCGTECPKGTNAECTNGEKCFAGMVQACKTITRSPTMAVAGTSAPTSPPLPASSKCKASTIYSGVAGITEYCQLNCPAVCPASHCVCGDAQAFANPNAKTYVPNCETYTTTMSNETFLSIAVQFDLPQEDTPESKAAAAEALSAYNRGCNSNLPSTVSTVITTGSTIYITGDCQLTSVCQPSQPSAAASLSSRVSIILVSIFGLMLLC